jgi:hypothetical protein
MKALKWTIAPLFFFLCAGAGAQVTGGGEIYYRLVSGKKYLVTAHIYRQCDKAPLAGLDGFVIADTFRIPMNFVRTNIQRINDTCGDPCNIKNAVSRKGFEKHTFEDTVDFNQGPYQVIKSQQICEVRFAIHQQLRDPNIMTHNVGTGMFYLDAMVNICLSFQKVHSPVFSFDPKLIYACNQPVWYTPGPMDTMDFDSMSFALDTPMIDRHKPVTYNAPFNVLIPMTPYCPPNPGIINCRALPNAKPPRGFYFDPELCQMGVTATKCDEVATVKFRACEWRRDSSGKFVMIGYVCREMLARVTQQKDNNPPYFIGSTKKAVCNGNTICFNIETKDEPFLPKQTVPDTVTLLWNYGLPTAKFNILNPSEREKTAQFCWPSSATNTGTYIFSTMAYDKVCNHSLTSSGYLIRQLGKSDYKKSFTIDNCNKVRYKVEPIDSTKKVSGYINIINSAGKNLFSSGGMKDSFTINANGTFYIRYTISSFGNGACPVVMYDTLQVSNALLKGFEYPFVDTSVCSSYPFELGFKPSSIPGISSWTWLRNDTLISNTDSILKGHIYKTAVFRLKITDTRGCRSESIRTYQAYKVNQDLFVYANRYCPGEVKTMVAMTNTLAKPLVSRWIYNGVDTSFAGDTFTLLPKGNMNIHVRIIDKNHCIVDDDFTLDSLFKPTLTLSVHKTKYCEDSTVEVSGKLAYSKNITQTIWTINGVDTITPPTLKLKWAFNDTSEVILRIKGDFVCTGPDTMLVTPIRNPEVSLMASAPVCSGSTASVRASIEPGLSNRTITWTMDGKALAFADTLYTYATQKNSMFKVKVGNESVCFDEDTVSAFVFPLPELWVEYKIMVNQYEKLEMKTVKPYVSYKWWNGKTTRNIDLWAYELGPPGGYRLWCEVQDSNGCVDSDTFYIYTDNFTSIGVTAKDKIQLYPNPASDQLVIHSAIEGQARLYNSEGKLVVTLDILAGENLLSVDGFANGVYSLEVGGVGYRVVVFRE